MKTCGVCGETKPLTEFNVRKASRDGRQSRCRRCASRRGADRNPLATWTRSPATGSPVPSDSQPRQAFTLDGFKAFAATLRLEDGQPLTLEAFQERFLTSIFDGVSDVTVLLPKKSGKSTLIAAVALYRLVCDPDGDIAVCASARAQASYLFRRASKLVSATPSLKAMFHVLPGRKEIRHREGTGELTVLASDSSSADGWLGDFAIADELSNWASADMHTILRGGVLTRDGQIICISTAGDDQLSPLGVIRASAYDLPVRLDLGAYHYRADTAGTVAFHEWALSDEANRDDMTIVKLANPASWVTTEKLQAMHDNPGTPPWKFARFYCGVWLQGEDSAIDPRDWDTLQQPGVTIPAGERVWLGLDLGWRQDTTAIVPLWWQADTRRVLGAPVILAPPEGGSVDDRDIVNAILSFDAQYRLQGVVYDPNAGGQQMAQQIEREHRIQFVEHSQMSATRSRSDVALMEALRRKELVHDWPLEARAHILNAIAKDRPDGSWFFTRSKIGPRKPTDALIALSMVHAIAMAEEQRPLSALYGFGRNY